MTVTFRLGGLDVRPAHGARDLRACQDLRGARFLGGGARDADAHDDLATHLMISDASGLLATCRVLVLPDGARIDTSYAAQFYDLAALRAYPQPLLELGRLCVASNGCDADVLRALWGALARIVVQQGIGLIFGCSSFAGTAAQDHAAALALLAADHVGPARWRPARRTAKAIALPRHIPDRALALRQMPPLLRSYLGLGAWVSDHAVIDRQLGTIHVFTGLEVAAIPPARARALRALAAVH